MMNKEIEQHIEMFQKQMLEETMKTTPAYVVKNIDIQIGITLVGIFILLGLCFVAFDGAMVPAMWQLTSMIWMIYRIWKV
jgi:hypothetical protein